MGQAKVAMAVAATEIDQLATARQATAGSTRPRRRGTRPTSMIPADISTIRASSSSTGTAPPSSTPPG